MEPFCRALWLKSFLSNHCLSVVKCHPPLIVSDPVYERPANVVQQNRKDVEKNVKAVCPRLYINFYVCFVLQPTIFESEVAQRLSTPGVAVGELKSVSPWQEFTRERGCVDSSRLKLIVGFFLLNSLIYTTPCFFLGLAWTAMGGEIMFVEATRMGGEGKLTLTGQLGKLKMSPGWDQKESKAKQSDFRYLYVLQLNEWKMRRRNLNPTESFSKNLVSRYF